MPLVVEHLTPEGLQASWHPMFSGARGPEGGGTPELRPPPAQPPSEEDQYTSPEEVEDDARDELIDEDDADHLEDELDEEQHEGEAALPFDPNALGLKEISNLGKFTVSSHKPGSGVDELRSDDTELYWQYVLLGV